MTRKEITGIRELKMSGWIKDNLPDSSTGFMVTDLDFFIFDLSKKKLMFIEVKTRNAPIRTWQNSFFCKLERWIKKGIDSDWTFYGFHVITFSNTFFSDGTVKLDGKETSEESIKLFLSFL